MAHCRRHDCHNSRNYRPGPVKPGAMNRPTVFLSALVLCAAASALARRPPPTLSRPTSCPSRRWRCRRRARRRPIWPRCTPHIHRRWTDNFLRLIGEKLELNNPLNVPDRTAEVDVVISPRRPAAVVDRSRRSSGFPGFDDAIIEILRDAVPFPKPPSAVRSDDDNLRLHWVFARDQRRCSGVAVTRSLRSRRDRAAQAAAPGAARRGAQARRAGARQRRARRARS